MSKPSPAESTTTALGSSVEESATLIVHLLFVAMPLGALVGVGIAAYDWIVNEFLWKHVTEHSLALQMAAPFFGMCITGLILHAFRVTSSAMADEVVNAYHTADGKMPLNTALPKLAASVATMGLGASAGMEGASKWLGGTIASLAQQVLNKLRLRAVQWDLRTSMLAGASAGIAAIFRAPLSGAIMGVESPYKKDLAHDALLPALVASATSFWAFSHLRPADPYFPVTFQYTLHTRDVLIAIPLGFSCGIAAHLFLWTMGRCRKWFGQLETRAWAKPALGGLLLAGLAYLAFKVVGAPVTLQSGLPVANKLLHGDYTLAVCLTIFALKLVATAITFGSGGVGGQFVPTATIGAAVGACWDQVFAASHPGVYTLLGIAAFSGASYNSLLFSAIFIAEATGNVFLVVPALVASTFAFLVSAGVSNSRAQRKHRGTWEEQLAEVKLEAIMSRQVVTAAPTQTIEDFSRSVLLTHRYRALPVVDGTGALQGIISVTHLRNVPVTDWGKVLVADIMDPGVCTLYAENTAADAHTALQAGPYDYIPVVEKKTFRLVGIVSDSDVYRSVGTSKTAPAAAEPAAVEVK